MVIKNSIQLCFRTLVFKLQRSAYSIQIIIKFISKGLLFLSTLYRVSKKKLTPLLFKLAARVSVFFTHPVYPAT